LGIKWKFSLLYVQVLLINLTANNQLTFSLPIWKRKKKKGYKCFYRPHSII